MKNTILLCLLLLFASLVTAQECHEYFPFNAGTEWEMTSYDDKSNVLSVTNYKIISIGSNVANLHMSSKDAKGKQLAEMQFKWFCDEDRMNFEMKDLFPQAGMMNNSDVEMKFSGDNLAYPKRMKAGDKLPDAESKIEIMMNGMRLMSMIVKITERSVGATENVTTPFGTLECLKLSETSEVKSIMSTKSKSVMWLSKSKGVVKTESYNQKGKLEGYTLMTRFKN